MCQGSGVDPLPRTEYVYFYSLISCYSHCIMYYVCLFLLLLCFLLTKENKVWKQQPLVIQALQAEPGYSTTCAYDTLHTLPHHHPSLQGRSPVLTCPLAWIDMVPPYKFHATLSILSAQVSHGLVNVSVWHLQNASMGFRSQMIPSEVQKVTRTGRQQFPHDPVETDDQSQPQTLICFVPHAIANLMLGTALCCLVLSWYNALWLLRWNVFLEVTQQWSNFNRGAKWICLSENKYLCP